jgi:hypothetical protein
MKLWLLKLTDEGLKYNDWDEDRGYVIRAPTEQEARRLAGEKASFYKDLRSEWNDSRFSTCEEICIEGDPEILLNDNRGS